MTDKAIRDPRDLIERLIKTGEEWAELNAAAELLEETKATLLSQYMADFISDAGSVAKAEMLAKGSPNYRDHLARMVEARKAANKARVRYDSGRAYIELARSVESTRRAEMGLR